jgi:plastocyanin
MRNWRLPVCVLACVLAAVAHTAVQAVPRPPVRPAGSSGVVTIRMRSDTLGAHVWFDPAGVYVAPGTTVRWIIDSNAHSTTAYHPKNMHHSLRIPPGAKPWDSSVMPHPGQSFEVRLTVPGVYDYFCIPHESAGMVGRIVVGSPSGPGTLPFDYFRGRPEARDWVPVPDAARRSFPSVAEIIRRKVVPGHG